MKDRGSGFSLGGLLELAGIKTGGAGRAGAGGDYKASAKRGPHDVLRKAGESGADGIVAGSPAQAQALIEAFEAGVIGAFSQRLETDLDFLGFGPVGANGKNTPGFRGYDLEPSVRERAVHASRRLIANPVVSQIYRLWKDFTVGTGISLHSAGNRKSLDTAIRSVWGWKGNHDVFSPRGQGETFRRLIVDGEVPFLISPDRGEGVVRVRRMQSELLADVITSPDDSDEVWGWLRVVPGNKPGSPVSYAAVRDWKGLGPDGGVSMPDPVTGTEREFPWMDDVVLYQSRINTMGHRGNPVILPSIGWAAAMDSFMRSRVMVARAVASFAWKVTIKGSKGDMSRIRSVLQTRITGSADSETNPGPGPGGFFYGNEGAKLDAMKFETGAEAAKTDGQMILLHVAIGAGIFPHWVGAGDSFRLATAKSMEPPMRKMFQAAQNEWCEDMKNVFIAAAEMMRFPGVPAKALRDEVMCIAPEIMQNDANERLQTFSRLIAEVPWLSVIPDVNQRLLQILGHGDSVKLYENHQDEINGIIKKFMESRMRNPSQETGRKPMPEEGVQERKEQDQGEGGED